MDGSITASATSILLSSSDSNSDTLNFRFCSSQLASPLPLTFISSRSIDYLLILYGHLETKSWKTESNRKKGVIGWWHARIQRSLGSDQRNEQYTTSSKTKEILSRTTFVVQTFSDRKQTSHGSRQQNTWLSKVVKRSKLFLLDKCFVLFCEKFAPFDESLKLWKLTAVGNF